MMRMPEPYFENVLSYGNLSMEEILVEDIYPVLFVLKDSGQQRFLCVCCEIRDEQRWIINRITNSDMVAFLCNQITARELFEKGQSQIVAVRSYATKEEHFGETGKNKLDDRDLPRVGVYLDAEASEFSEYLQKLIEENE